MQIAKIYHKIIHLKQVFFYFLSDENAIPLHCDLKDNTK